MSDRLYCLSDNDMLSIILGEAALGTIPMDPADSRSSLVCDGCLYHLVHCMDEYPAPWPSGCSKTATCFATVEQVRDCLDGWFSNE